MIKMHNVDFEQAVLAALMIIDKAYDEVSNKLQVESFLSERHKTIYSAITAIKKQGGSADALMVLEWLGSRKMLVLAGGEEYLVKLLTDTPASLYNLSQYVDRLNDLAVRRLSIEVLDKARDQIVNNPERLACDVLSDAMGELGQASAQESDKGAVDMRAALRAQVAHMERVAADPDGCFGQRTGFVELDNQIGGMAAGDLIIIGARPSMGKTTFAMNLVDFAAGQSGKPWLVISLEMPTLQITERLQSATAGVRLGNIRSGCLDEAEWVKYTAASAHLLSVPIHINDKGQQTLAEIRREAVALKRKYGQIGGVMVDYIGLMGGLDPNNKVNSIGVVSAGLKALAKELACPVVALSQLNRGLENRPNKRPVPSDLRESGSIEQDADIILFIYRDEVYNPESHAKGSAEIIIGKQRNGPLGTAILGFEGQYSRFTNIIRRDDVNYN
jgi:replicative DNA helicase